MKQEKIKELVRQNSQITTKIKTSISKMFDEEEEELFGDFTSVLLEKLKNLSKNLEISKIFRIFT